jgi:hypothetical protein
MPTVLRGLGATPPVGVLRVRSAITNTRQAHWWLNGAAHVAGIGLAVVGLPGPPAPNPGGASEEIEVNDARTGRRLAALATYNNGMPWQPLGYYRQFGHARQSFEQAAQLLIETIHPNVTAAPQRPPEPGVQPSARGDSD